MPGVISSWTSALLPRYAPYVKYLQVSGTMMTRHPPKNCFPEALQNAIKTWTNLCSIRFTTTESYGKLFTEPLRLLRDFSSLHTIHLGGAWLDDEQVPILVELERLKSVTIVSPSRAMLSSLPGWLRKLEENLIQLHLLDDCGSVTPGVLRSFVPHLRNVRSFSLGLSYSITDQDLFDAISELPCIEDLGVFYYYQQKLPAKSPKLPHLRSLTVTLKSRPTSAQNAEALSKWIRLIISPASHDKTSSRKGIEILRINEERLYYDKSLKFDSLVYHLTAKHASSLRVLDIQGMFISVRALKVLFEKCTALEVLTFSSGKNLLMQFEELAHKLPRLHTVGLVVEHTQFRLDPSEEASRIFRNVPSLKRLSVDRRTWDGFWVNDIEGREPVLKIIAR
ncbi:hypothetical protein VKT23_014246 [Stygiomarasmius scandens]|uniref:Uncharacterized protein n=1 Tax=Marasmiellus scandens TaxID=2682957 RepID=A0ABR1J489_9AGAR